MILRPSNMPTGVRVDGVPIVRASLREGMEAYDQLPPVVREALNYAHNRISPTNVLGYIRDGVSETAVAMAIRETDKKIDQAFRERDRRAA